VCCVQTAFLLHAQDGTSELFTLFMPTSRPYVVLLAVDVDIVRRQIISHMVFFCVLYQVVGLLIYTVAFCTKQANFVEYRGCCHYCCAIWTRKCYSFDPSTVLCNGVQAVVNKMIRLRYTRTRHAACIHVERGRSDGQTTNLWMGSYGTANKAKLRIFIYGVMPPERTAHDGRLLPYFLF